MAGWRRLGWPCAVVLIYAEYVWLSMIDRVLPAFSIGLEPLVFPAVVLAMPGGAVFVGALLYNLARRRPIRPADVAAAVICIALTVVILRW